MNSKNTLEEAWSSVQESWKDQQTEHFDKLFMKELRCDFEEILSCYRDFLEITEDAQ